MADKRQVVTLSGQESGAGTDEVVAAPVAADDQDKLRIIPKRVHLSVSNTAVTTQQFALNFNGANHFVTQIAATSLDKLEIEFPIAVLDPGTNLSVFRSAGFTGTVDWTVTYKLDD